MELVTAFALGFLGSLHCIGMCGPLALAVPSNAKSKLHYFLERSTFNLGRVFTYVLLGVFVGLLGDKLLFVNSQQYVSLSIGSILLLTVLIPYGFKSRLQKYSPLTALYAVVKKTFATFLKKKGNTTLWILGMVNGMLPCGLVYTALLGAAAVADSTQSGIFMALFGIGTLPALLAVAFAGKLISVKFRSRLSKILPALSIALAMLLILRGLNLGIPLVSPKLSHVHNLQQAEMKTEMGCCK